MSGFLVNRLTIVALITVLMYLAVFALTFGVARTKGVTLERFIVATGDSTEYVNIAQTLIREQKFQQSLESYPEVFRSPGYPVFLAILLFLTGSLIAIPVAQILIAACSAVVIVLIGERYFSRTVGLFAAGLFALEPVALSHAFIALSETLFVFLLLLTVWLGSDESPSRQFSSGVALGFAALVRPVGLYIVPLFILWLVWRRRNELRGLFVLILSLTLGVALVVSPWMMRNVAVGGAFSISSIGSYNPLFYNIVVFEAARTGLSQDAIRTEIYSRLGTTDGTILHTFAYAAQKKALTKEYVLAHPFEYASFHMIKTIPFFLGSGLFSTQALLHIDKPAQDINISALAFSGDISGVMRALVQSPLALLEILGWCAVSVLSLAALPVSWIYRRDVFPVALFFVTMIGAFAIATGPIAMPRYRVPVEPFLFLLAFFSVHQISMRFFGAVDTVQVL